MARRYHHLPDGYGTRRARPSALQLVVVILLFVAVFVALYFMRDMPLTLTSRLIIGGMAITALGYFAWMLEYCIKEERGKL